MLAKLRAVEKIGTSWEINFAPDSHANRCQPLQYKLEYLKASLVSKAVIKVPLIRFITHITCKFYYIMSMFSA